MKFNNYKETISDNQWSDYYEKCTDEIQKKLDMISTTYQITQENVKCCLLNYEDDYICHKYNGGCRNVNKCREIFEKEKNKTE